MNFKKMSAKALSVFMSLIMLFSFVAPAVSAAAADDHNHVTEKPDLNYVSLGDSMSNGYGLDGYGQDGYFDIFAEKNIGKYGEGAYTLQFEKYLAEMFEVNHSKLAVSAMLSRDLLFLLGGSEYIDDNYNGFIDYLGVHNSKVDSAFLTDLQALYIEKITDADLITMGLGNAEFGAYIMHRLMDCIGFNKDASHETVAPFVELEKLMETCDAELVAKVIEARDELLAKLPQIGEFSDEQVETIANLLAYTVLDFCNNYTKILDRIVELNPDVEIVVVGLMNTLNGMQFKVDEDTTVDFGAYMGEFLKVINAHLTTYATVQIFEDEAYADATIYFAEASDVEVIVETYAKGLNETVRSRFHSEIVGKDGIANGMIWSMNPALPYITLEQIEAFEANKADYINNPLAKVFQFYLGIEKAIMNASEGATVGFDSLIALSDLENSEAFAYFMAAAGINPATGALGVYDSSVILAYIEANQEDMLNGFLNEIGEEFKTTGCPSYLTKKVSIFNMLTKYVYESEDLSGFFADIKSMEESELVEKLTQGVYHNYYETVLSSEEFYSGTNYMGRSRTIAQGIYDLCTEGVVEKLESYVAVEFMTDYMADMLCADETVKGLLNFLGRCKIGNGIGTHPSEVGHDDLFNAVRESYVNQHTVVDETVDNIILIRDFIFENYKEIYAYIYDKAVEEGVIAELDAYLVDAINAVRYAENWANGYSDYFRSENFAIQITASADSTVATIEALRAVLANADELDADLNATIVALLAQLEANLADLANLINAAIADAYAYGAPIVDAEIAKALAFINAKVNAVLETIAYIEAKVQEQIAIAEAMIADFIATAEAYLAKLMGDAASNLADAKAYLNALLNAFLSNSAYYANYTVNADSYYVAIGGDDALYAELLAAKLGLDDKFTAMNWNNLDSSIIAKADLITIGYTESMISGFATEQILAYVANYIDVTLRDSANKFVEEALSHFFGNMTPAPSAETVEMVIAQFAVYLNGAIDGIVTENGLADAEIADMDWAELVGEENVSYIDEALNSITGALVEAGLTETFTKEINVLDILLEKLDEIDPSIAAMLLYFDVEEVKAMFGEYATYTLEIPVADAVAFALESYFYSYAKFNVEYAQLVYAINAINPDAQIVLLGNYNAFAGLGFDFVVDGVSIDLGEIFTSDIQNSANSYANEVFEKIFATLEDVTDDDAIDSALGFVDSSIKGGADALYDIILDVLANAETVRDYIDGTELALPEITMPSCPALEAVLGMINFNALADVNWELLVGFDAVEAVAAAAEAINNAIAEVENTLVELGLLESYTITLPTLDLIYANLDKFDAETRAMIESLDYAELRAMLGDLADYVVEVKTISAKALDYVNGLYNQLAETEITVFEGATIDLGAILSAPISMHSLFYAYAMKNVIFVDISDADIASEATSIADFIAAYIADNSVADVTEAGHAYIAEQIYAALNAKCGHYDLDNDHYCDNKVCGDKLTDCVDEDMNHNCDLCGAELSACADGNKDHNCDYCGNKISDCADTNKDHNCDTCGKKLTDCADTNKDHNCDTCGKKLTDCADTNKDHNCDTCGKKLTDCADTNKDHNCDSCGKKLTDCADTNNDHNCDTCGTKLTECADANNDHNCDTCGTKLTECADANNDHNCDLCGNKVSDCADDNHDHKCDACGATVSECQFGEWVVSKEATKKEAGEEKRTCSICGAVETRAIAQLAGLSAGVVVAIVSGSAAVTVAIGLAGYFFIFKKRH